MFLKELRSEKSITQAELAELLGVSNRSISRWENGTTMPDFDLLIALGFVVGTLLTGLLYASHYMAKIRAAKMRLVAGMRNLK